jgi:hypothetical protein
MQTFVPLTTYEESAAVLDRLRLGKQRVEVKQILQTLLGESRGRGWKNHPAVKMWLGHEQELCRYGIAMCNEWTLARGYKDSLREYFSQKLEQLPDSGPPPWIGEHRVHSSHRSNLLRKMPEWYTKFGWTEPSDLPYVWPVQ